MKATAIVYLDTYYASGGDVASYRYKLSQHAMTYLATSSWKFRTMRMVNPAAAVTITATSSFGTTGSPPAANARSITISPAGVVTLAAHETLSGMATALTLSDVEENPYALMSAEAIVESGITTATIGGLDAVSTFLPVVYIADTDTFSMTVAISAANVAANKLPSYAVAVAETDLVTRAYSGQYLELAGKALVSIAQVLSHQYQGIAAQAVNYLQSGNSPMALELSITANEWVVGCAL